MARLGQLHQIWQQVELNLVQLEPQLRHYVLVENLLQLQQKNLQVRQRSNQFGCIIMSEYRNLKGKKVKFLTSDLSGEQSEGQIVPCKNNDFKSVVASAAWSAGGNMATARKQICG